MRYAIVIERGANSYGAYSSDLPGCVAAGDTVAETVQLMREALAFHFEGVSQDGESIPDPQTRVEYVEVDLPSQTKHRRWRAP